MSCFLCCCNSDSSNNENAGMEEGWDPKIVSMNGSRLYTKDDVPEAVIKAMRVFQGKAAPRLPVTSTRRGFVDAHLIGR